MTDPAAQQMAWQGATGPVTAVAVGPPPPAAPGDREILLVDDSAAQRAVLARMLTRWGYRVCEAASGEEALELCRSRQVDIVLSDWMMPGMSGIAFCQAFRALPRAGYGYFILLTSKTDKAAVARGLQEGADDFLSKPVSPTELRARITAGERILRMERQLQEQNRLVTETLAQLQEVHAALGRDLSQARQLQQSLVSEGAQVFGRATVSLILRPAGHVGGDLVGAFAIGAHHVGLFAIDVSGHGVTAALLAARLAGLFSGAAPAQNIALVPAAGADGAAGRLVGRPPAEVAATLNRLMLEEVTADHYCTLAYAQVDLRCGALRLVQAGHPHPMIQRACGRVEVLGDGGLPVGLIEGASYTEVRDRLGPGDRLLIVSDGVTECTDRADRQFGAEGLVRLAAEHRAQHGPAFLEATVAALRHHTAGAEFPDDVSAVLLEMAAAPQPAADSAARLRPPAPSPAPVPAAPGR
ncbi:MAG: PP2C family protein-serine/threonine phosphatase [Alkalilacustris sp.]